jgi:CRP-like cAMP-binding protein
MSSKIVVSGDLNFLTLGDVIQLIGSSGGTGILRVMCKYSPEPGFIYFVKGNIINGVAPSLKGLDAVYSLFGWIEGEYEFSLEDVEIEKVVNTPRMEIILDGLRMVDEGIIKKLGPVSYEKSEGGDTKKLPIIRGPIVDYMYVLDEEFFSQGYKIIEENRHGNWIWVILEGQVDIIKDTPKGPLTILRMDSGAFIGTATSFLARSKPRKATALAVTDVQLGVLDTQRLSEEYAQMSPELKNLVLSVEKRQNEVTDQAVNVYLQKADVKAFTKGKKLVIKQGSKDEKVFMIKKGTACVVRQIKEGYVPLAHLSEGDLIGDIPFLAIGHEPYNASVFAGTDFEVTRLNLERLNEEYDGLSSTFRNLIESTATTISITSLVACDFLRHNTLNK